MKMVKGVVFAVLGLAATGAMAGTLGGSAEFGGVYTLIRDWIDGDVGGIMALLIFAVGLGFGIMKQSLGAIVVGLGGALAASNGADVIEGIMGAGLPVVDAAASVVQNVPTL